MSRAGGLVRGVLRRLLGAGRTPGDRGEPPAGAGGVPSRPPPPPEPEEASLEVEVPVPGSLLLDIREPGELAGGVAEGAMLLPMNLVPHHLAELPRDRPLTIYCAAGARSWGVAHWLREQGFPEAWSLVGGIGVFGAIGVPVRPPPGLMPGTRVRLPPTATAGGVVTGVALVGEVIQQVGDRVQVVVQDTQGFPVRIDVALSEVVRA
jgi:rhodanese-related sulfurtransferase